MIFVFVFVTFLYLKIMSELLLDTTMTITGALLSAVVAGALSFAAQILSVAAVGKWIERERMLRSRSPSVPLGFPIAATFIPYFASVALTVLATYLIVIGFSPELLRALRTYRADDDVFWFIVMTAIPPLASYAIWIGIYREMARQDV